MPEKSENPYKGLKKGSQELIDKLVEENMGWATAIAKSVAKSWSLDWQQDGLDGGAFEGLVFCAGRFDPSLGIPFRGYARRRIHEAATEQARKSKNWKRGVGGNSEAENTAREISAQLFHIFPELREGLLPTTKNNDGEQDTMRQAVKQLITSAALVSAHEESLHENQENILDFKRLLEKIALLEPVHQSIIYGVYWKGQSLREIASEWGTDELAVIREHKVIIEHLGKIAEQAKKAMIDKPLKVRRALRSTALELRKTKKTPFEQFLNNSAAVFMLFLAVELNKLLGTI